MLRQLSVIVFASSVAVVAPAATNVPPGKVSAFLTATGMVSRTITVGRFPQRILVSPTGTQVFVASTDAGTVTAINVARGTTRTIRFRGFPVAMALTPGGKQLYVSVTDGPLSLRTGRGHVDVIATAGDRLVKSIGLNEPGLIAISPDGRTAFVVNTDWVTGTGAEMVTPIRTATGTKERAIRIASGTFHPDGFVMAPGGRTAYLLNDNRQSWPSDPAIVTPIRTATRRALRPIRAGNLPFDMAIAPDGRTLWVTSTSGVIPIATGRLTARRAIKVGHCPCGLVVTPDSKTVYVTGNNVVRPISAATGTAGQPILLSGTEGPDANPGAIAVSPDGRTVYVIARVPQRTGVVVEISTATSTLSGRIQVGVDPTQIVIAPKGKYGYVLDYGR